MHTALFTLTAIAVTLSMANHWAYSQGRLAISYPLAACIYTLYLVIETTLAITNVELRYLFLFDVVNVFGLVMALRGYRRLRRERSGVPK